MRSATPQSGGAPVEWSRKAIACAALGILGFATLWLGLGLILAAAAAVVGHVARDEVAQRALRGRGFTTLGLWLGYGSMFAFPLLVLLALSAFPALATWRAGQDSAQRATSRDHASQLFVACEAYARANRNHYPADWEDLSGRYLPAARLDELLRSPHPGGRGRAFELVRHDRPVLPALVDSVVVIQELAPRRVPRIAVVYASGRVDSLHNPEFEAP